MMKFGLLTAILDGWTFEEVVDIASEMGFQCLEVACWPAGKAERRYAGVSHIDAERVLEDDAYAAYVKELVASHGLEISSLAFYPNVLDADAAKAGAAIAHLKNLIRASAKLVSAGSPPSSAGISTRPWKRISNCSRLCGPI